MPLILLPFSWERLEITELEGKQIHDSGRCMTSIREKERSHRRQNQEKELGRQSGNRLYKVGSDTRHRESAHNYRCCETRPEVL